MLRWQVRLAQQLTARDPDGATAMLEDVQRDTTDALENLRQLARGIYPPLLADKGLATALEAQVRRAPLPVQIRDGGVGRFGQDVEAAVYFSCLEALQNVAKYAEATNAEIVLANGDGVLRFEVRDDGSDSIRRGPATAPVSRGSPTAWLRSRARSRSTARREEGPR
jgi:signal transduction histidine kinase